MLISSRMARFEEAWTFVSNLSNAPSKFSPSLTRHRFSSPHLAAGNATKSTMDARLDQEKLATGSVLSGASLRLPKPSAE